MIIDQLFTQPIFEDAAGPIDYTKPGPKSKSSMGHALEYGIPVNAKGAFINPSRLPNYEQLPDDEFGRMLTAYKTWLRDFLSRWPNGKLQPDGSMSSGTQGLAPMSPFPKLQENAPGPITQFASNAHEEWRRNFDPTGTKPRIKKNSDGTEGDINVPFEKLHPDWKKENLAAGHAAHHAVKHFGRDM